MDEFGDICCSEKGNLESKHPDRGVVEHGIKRFKCRVCGKIWMKYENAPLVTIRKKHFDEMMDWIVNERKRGNDSRLLKYEGKR